MAIINCHTEFSSLDNTMSNVLEIGKECALGENKRKKERRERTLAGVPAACHIICHLLLYTLSY